MPGASGEKHGQGSARDMWRYSMTFFAAQLIALMDHLQTKQALVMGTSLGANTALEMASAAPERLRGMVIEMPVLDNGLLPSALTFTPILVALAFGDPGGEAARAGRARGAAAAPPLLWQLPACLGPTRARSPRRAVAGGSALRPPPSVPCPASGRA